jgi:hypothetical protein
MSKIDKNSLGYLGYDYQLRLIAQILTDRKFANSIIDIVNPNYFEDPYLRVVAATIKDAKIKDDIIPDVGSLEFRLLEDVTDDMQRKYVISQLRKIQEADLNDTLKVQDIAMKFCKQQELKKSVSEITKIINKGNIDDYDQCEAILRKALEHGDNKDNGMDVFDNLDTVLDEDFRKPIRTGIKGLDDVMDGGLSKTELATILAPFGVGKSQPLTSNILTPNGWVTMGDVKVGDQVVSRDGKPTNVVGVYPQGVRPIYKISFNDGTSTLCDKEHLWAVNTINQRNRKTKKDGKIIYLEPDNSFKVMKTSDMIENVKVWGNRRLNYKIPNVQPIEFNKKDLIINPYLLGVILGDGCVTDNNQPHFVTKDNEIINEVNKVFPSISVKEQIREIEKEVDGELVLVKRSLTKVSLLGIKDCLVNLGLYGTNSSSKFIPKDYLYSSVSDRISILQGLVDTDGYIDNHRVEISTVSKQLSEDIKELVLSLGGRISVSEKQGSYKKFGVRVTTKKYYRISFSFPDNGVVPSRLTRKLSNFNPRTKYGSNKFIANIEYSHDEEAQCIMVDNPEHLYVTDDYIVTHNTTMMTKIANTAMLDGYKVLQIFFEDNPKVIQRKHLSCWSGYDLNSLSLHKDELINMTNEMIKGKGQLKLKKFSSDGTTIPVIRQYIRKLIAQGWRPDILILDYIDCVEPSKKFDDVNIGEGSVMRQFETMLSELDLAGWTAIQGNRSSIKADVVEADQMGGSIKKAQIAHFVVSIAKTLDQKEAGTATMAILKSRFGKSGLIFEDIKFDNASIQIDMGQSTGARTHSEHKQSKGVNEQQRVNSVLEAAKQRNAVLNALSVPKIEE